MKTILILTAAVCFLSANSFSSDLKGKDDVNKPSLEKTHIKDKSQKVKPITVKNIWKNMPSYDRFGNEITAKARFNMEQNRILEQQKAKEEKNNSLNNFTEEIK